MNIEQICKDAIEVVERYLASDLVAADCMDLDEMVEYYNKHKYCELRD